MRIVDLQSGDEVVEIANLPWERCMTPGTKTTFHIARVDGPYRSLVFLTDGLISRVANKINRVLDGCHQVRGKVLKVRIEHSDGRIQYGIFANLRPGNDVKRYAREVLKRIESGVDRSMRAAERNTAKQAETQPGASLATV